MVQEGEKNKDKKPADTVDTKKKDPENTEPENTEPRDSEEAERKRAERAEQEAQDKQAENDQMEKMKDQFVGGQEIVKNAAGTLSGDAKTLFDYSVDKLNDTQEENVGLNFYGWVKKVYPLRDAFQKDLQEKTGTAPSAAETADALDEQKQEERRKVGATRSLAKSVNRFIDDANGIPPAENDVEKAWEEIRHNAQREFESENPAEQQAAWLAMGQCWCDKYLMEVKKGPLASMDASMDKKYWQEQQQKLDEKGLSYVSMLEEIRAKNLFDDAKETHAAASKIKVQLLDADKKEIKNKEDLQAVAAGKKLGMAVTAQKGVDIKTVVSRLETNPNFFPKFSVKDNVLRFEGPVTLEQGRRFFQLVGTQEVLAPGEKPPEESDKTQ